MSKDYSLILFAVIAFAVLIGLVMFNASRSKGVSSSTPLASASASPVFKRYPAPPPLSINPQKTYTATLSTNMGDITVELFAKDNPQTVNNFVFLAREHYYDNTPFHRIIRGFMIQGGDPTGTGQGNPGYKFADEKITRDYKRGTIAMANSGPDTNGSQFFIMHQDYNLPKNYVIFGRLPDNNSISFDSLDAIASVSVVDNGAGEPSSPQDPVILKSVAIVEK